MDDMIRRPKRPSIDLSGNMPEPQVVRPTAYEAVSDEAPAETIASRMEPNPTPEDKPIAMQVPGSPPVHKGRRFKISKPQTKRQWIITICAAVLLLGGIAGAVYWFALRNTVPEPVAQQAEPEPEPEPEPIYDILTGREITDAAVNERPIYAVQIENSMEARPQSGLKEAGIVTEAVAEGGITRFNAIYHDLIPTDIGPVRSLRPYFIDWFLPYDAALVHAGGSPEALQDVGRLGVKDMDSVASIMRRISTRYSPHNYYTTGQQVLDLAVQRDYKPNIASPLPRKEVAPAEVPTAGTINIRISSAPYNVKYVWNKESNSYLREQDGAKHVDAVSGKQLGPDVVVVPIITKRIHPDGVHTQYTTTGSGKVYVFQDGSVTVGTWTKSSRSAQWVLEDTAGTAIKLNPGQTWFTITDANGNVSYTP